MDGAARASAGDPVRHLSPLRRHPAGAADEEGGHRLQQAHGKDHAAADRHLVVLPVRVQQRDQIQLCGRERKVK